LSELWKEKCEKPGDDELVAALVYDTHADLALVALLTQAPATHSQLKPRVSYHTGIYGLRGSFTTQGVCQIWIRIRLSGNYGSGSGPKLNILTKSMLKKKIKSFCSVQQLDCSTVLWGKSEHPGVFNFILKLYPVQFLQLFFA